MQQRCEWRPALFALLFTWVVMAGVSATVYNQRYEPPSKSFRL